MCFLSFKVTQFPRDDAGTQNVYPDSRRMSQKRSPPDSFPKSAWEQTVGDEWYQQIAEPPNHNPYRDGDPRGTWPHQSLPRREANSPIPGQKPRMPTCGCCATTVANRPHTSRCLPKTLATPSSRPLRSGASTDALPQAAVHSMKTLRSAQTCCSATLS